MLIFDNNDVNNGRQKNIDYAKGLAVILMVFIHVLMYPESNILHGPYSFLVYEVLGGFLAAPIFMFSMGVSMNYTRNQSPDAIIKRGFYILIIGYLLHFARSIGEIAYYFLNGDLHNTINVLLCTFDGDILPFAGLTFILVGIFKKFKLSNFTIVIIGIVLNLISSCIPKIITDNIFIIRFLGVFIPIQGVDDMLMAFPLFSWFICVVLGNYFGYYLKKVKNLNMFYIIVGISAAIFTTIMCIIEKKFDFTGLYTGFEYAEYYNHIIYALMAIGIVLVEYSALHFIVKLMPKTIDNIMLFLSSYVTEIYIISWIIILNINYLIFGIIYEKEYEPWVFALLFIFTLATSIYLGKKLKDFRNKKLKRL